MAAAVSSASQTIASFQDDRVSQDVHPLLSPSRSGSGLRERRASALSEALWPKAVVVLGLGLNVVWVGLIGWGLVRIVIG